MTVDNIQHRGELLGWLPKTLDSHCTTLSTIQQLYMAHIISVIMWWESTWVVWKAHASYQIALYIFGTVVGSGI